MFVQQYRRTTEMCGLSPDENVTRLEKCLKGKAREAVLPILGLPESVERVMQTLGILFGRSDQIIKTMIQKVKAVPPPSTSKPESLIIYSNLVANLVATMKNLGSTGQMTNPPLLEELVQRLSYHQQFSWCGYAKKRFHLPTLADFQDWLSDTAMTASMMPSTSTPTEDKPDKKKEKKFVMATMNKNDKTCYFCGKEGHWLTNCKTFEDANVQTRWNTIKNESLCYACLLKGHKGGDCKKRIVCGLDGCDRFHHKLLHKTQNENPKMGANVLHVDISKAIKEVLLRVIPVKLYGPAGTVSTFALLDEGATITMIDTSVADKLCLMGEKDPLCMQWTNEVTREEADSRRVEMEISGHVIGAKKFRLNNVRTVSRLALTTQTVDMDYLQDKRAYLRDIPFPSLKKASPMILIGADNSLLITPRQLRHGHWNDPVATKTWLGWVVHGNVPIPRRVDRSLVHICTESSNEEKLMQMIKETFSTESFGVRVVSEKRRSKEDERAMKLMESTTRRVGVRFETGLIWRSGDIKLPESRINALRRLYCMERKMDKDPNFFTGEALNEAQLYWWQKIQENHFPEDLKALKANTLAQISKLRTLSPFLDAKGVIRMNGRTEKSKELSFETKYPIILDPEHRYTQLLLSHIHKDCCHQGVETGLSTVRLEYWIIRGRAAVKRTSANCQWCKIRRAKPCPPLLGPLPAERLTKQQRPFAVTGLDFFGPFTVLINRKHVKRYGALFTCFSIRAIHLEVAYDLSTDSASNVIRRFIARRGTPEILWSDNGTNFHGADREMRNAIREIDGDKITKNVCR